MPLLLEVRIVVIVLSNSIGRARETRKKETRRNYEGKKERKNKK